MDNRKKEADYEKLTGIFYREEHTDGRFGFSFSIRQTESHAVFNARFFDKEDKEIKISKTEIAGAEDRKAAYFAARS